MCDETFFQTSLPEHIKAKGAESADPPSVHVKLRHGQEYKIGRILEVSPQWVMCEVYPPDGKPPRLSSAPAQHAGAPRHDLDRLAIAYEYAVGALAVRSRRYWGKNTVSISGTFQNRAKVVDSLPGYMSVMAGCRPNPALRAKLAMRL